MSFPFITGKATQPPPQPVDLPQPSKAKQLDPAGYLIDQPLVDAINVALLLSQPLLITGEPGTGKTQLAYRVAWELGLSVPLRFDTKSGSTARDVLYRYDALSRFHAARLVALIARPGIAVIVVAADIFPESQTVFRQQLDTVNPLEAFVEVSGRRHGSERVSVGNL